MIPQSNVRISEDENHFTEEQQSFISDLDETMNNISSTKEFYASIDEYRNRVINNSAMSGEQKIEMLAMVEYSNALYEYLITGGISEIKEILPEVDNLNNRSARITQERPKYRVLECDEKENAGCGGGGGCSLDWRSLWSDAVVGFFGGVGGGCYAGATHWWNDCSRSFRHSNRMRWSRYGKWCRGIH